MDALGIKTCWLVFAQDDGIKERLPPAIPCAAVAEDCTMYENLPNEKEHDDPIMIAATIAANRKQPTLIGGSSELIREFR